MSLKIVCSGYLVRYPLGGHCWHHFQYVVGLERMGHDVIYFEDYGWPASCYDPSIDAMTADPTYGIAYMDALLHRCGLNCGTCFLAEDGTAYGMTRDELADACHDCDLYINLSNMNWIPELEVCRRRVLVDTDPVFTQIGGHGLEGVFSQYHARFTYGENVHRPYSTMPTGGVKWFPTRQPVVTDLWPVEAGDPAARITTVINWSAYGDREYDGLIYGQKDREFEPFFSLPYDTGESMEVAVDAPQSVRRRLDAGGWRVTNPMAITRTPWTYQQYLRSSRAEFCVAKHGYVSTSCGWFSDRSTGYLASGRPVIVQDTGFSHFLPVGIGILAYRSPVEAIAALQRLRENYEDHCTLARAIVKEYFDAQRVLTGLLERSL